MPKYRLTAQHYIDDRLLEPGTIIGDGTDVPFVDKDGKPCTPSPYMEGLDKVSQAEVAKVDVINVDQAIIASEPGVASEPAGK